MYTGGTVPDRASYPTRSEAEFLVDEHDGDPAGHRIGLVDHQLVHRAATPADALGPGILLRQRHVVHPGDGLIEGGHQLVDPDHPDDLVRAEGVEGLPAA